MRHVFFILCLLVQSADAGELFKDGNESLYSRALASAPAAAAPDMQSSPRSLQPNLRLRNSLIIGAGATLMLAYGAQNWWESGFGGGFDTTSEGWFGSGTPYGGADKLGHLYSNYGGMRLLVPIFESAGNSRSDSISLAAWSAFGIHTAVEIIDGFSRSWKFSPQDAIANAAGAALGVVLETDPVLDGILDFRIDYRRSPESTSFDPFGDYSGQKYLLVAKADGFELLRESRFLRYFEVALGYGTRGFDNGVGRRDLYAGLSLNLSRLLADGAYGGRMHSTPFQRGTDHLFELVQFPAIGYERWSVD